MMCDVYFADDVKSTRKPHTCEYCGRKIEVGEPALYEHGVFDNRGFGRYCCKECQPLMDDFWYYMDFECGELWSDFRDWIRSENIAHPLLTCEIECPSCGTVRVLRDDWEDDGWADCPKCGVTLERCDDSALII